MTVDARFNNRVIRYLDYPEIGYRYGVKMQTYRKKSISALAGVCLLLVLASGVDTRSPWGPAVIVPQVRDSFTSGGNVFYTFSKYLHRKFHSGRTDPTFNQEEYIRQHKIPYDQWSWFMGTTNELEARWLLEDIADVEYKRRLLVARGQYSAHLAWWIASGIGPLAVLLILVAIRRYSSSKL